MTSILVQFENVHFFCNKNLNISGFNLCCAMGHHFKPPHFSFEFFLNSWMNFSANVRAQESHTKLPAVRIFYLTALTITS